ncbi:GFA family protein [Thalassotalea montiporae]
MSDTNHPMLTGSCCCGKVSFSLADDFSQFYFCHCQQCQKLTGSAHAANLLTAPENIQWLQGEELLKRYDHPRRSFTKVFCTACGSGLPFLTQSKLFLIVPAGCLDTPPAKQPDAQIFCAEQTDWHQLGIDAPKHDGFPCND